MQTTKVANNSLPLTPTPELGSLPTREAAHDRLRIFKTFFEMPEEASPSIHKVHSPVSGRLSQVHVEFIPTPVPTSPLEQLQAIAQRKLERFSRSRIGEFISDELQLPEQCYPEMVLNDSHLVILKNPLARTNSAALEVIVIPNWQENAGLEGLEIQIHEESGEILKFCHRNSQQKERQRIFPGFTVSQAADHLRVETAVKSVFDILDTVIGDVASSALTSTPDPRI